MSYAFLFFAILRTLVRHLVQMVVAGIAGLLLAVSILSLLTVAQANHLLNLAPLLAPTQ